MTNIWADEEETDYFDPTGNGSEPPDSSASDIHYDALIDAPDYSALIKGRRSGIAREYETKIKSVLKSGAIGAIRAENLADAAAIFRHGPAIAAAAGDLADKSERTKHAIDLLTAPDNPLVMLIAAGIPLMAQLFRNHQPQVQQITYARRQMRRLRKFRKENPAEFAQRYPDLAKQLDDQDRQPKPKVTVNLPFGRKLTLNIGLRFNPLHAVRFGFRTQTRAPEELVTMVFSDQKLVAALKKMDIEIVQVKMPAR